MKLKDQKKCQKKLKKYDAKKSTLYKRMYYYLRHTYRKGWTWIHIQLNEEKGMPIPIKVLDEGH